MEAKAPKGPEATPAAKNDVEVKAQAEVTLAPATQFISNTPTETLSIDKKDIPIEATLDKLPQKEYWGGVTADAPFHSVQIGHLTLQKTSHSLVNGQPANPKIGMLLRLTDDQLKKIIDQSKQVAWRKREIKRKVGKEVRVQIVFDRIDLGNVNESLLRGDRLTANYIFIAPLKPGQKIPIGVMDEEGNPLPTPAPLIK